MTWLLIILLFLLLFLGVPVAFAISGATIIIVYFFTDIPMEVTAQRMFASLNSFPLLAIPLFILAGKLMENGGISKRLIDLATAFVGHTAGGYAAVAVLASMFFGALSGSSAATVAAIGAILIPAMIQKGYKPRFAAGTLAVSGELSAIIPPSIPMILYGVVTGTSIGSLFIAGILPGIMLGLSLILFVFVVSKIKGYGGDIEKTTWRVKFKAIYNSFFAILMPFIILGGIYGGYFTPTEAAAIAVVYALIIGLFVYRELEFKSLIKVFGESAITTSVIMVIISAAGVFSWFLTRNMVPQKAATFITEFTESPIVFLLMVNLLLLIVGMFFEASAAILILAPIFLPIAVLFGIDPIHFGMIMIVNLAIGMVTPPVGVNLFISCKIANLSLEEVTKGVLPFLVLLIINLLIISFVPSLSTWLPGLTK
ncbi:TRAP transporter large permease [Sporosarcina highlanderae]|uniref:TRAP transporter large permease n=1 Tax=Sporosarcina highlanderae TaxID=3035916 RepID=A0ABT8JVH1_9BACL|nr:TRAP transporter large permease [Sporosarcina highlanderae]MDN4609176.1 TRAP transporter large permease [Sporosarcina highlanderae]